MGHGRAVPGPEAGSGEAVRCQEGVGTCPAGCVVSTRGRGIRMAGPGGQEQVFATSLLPGWCSCAHEVLRGLYVMCGITVQCSSFLLLGSGWFHLASCEALGVCTWPCHGQRVSLVCVTSLWGTLWGQAQAGRGVGGARKASVVAVEAIQ